jgi:DNA-binding NtrC family response regulator
MFKWLTSLWEKSSLDSFNDVITRDRLIQNGRILFIDDEEPLLIKELTKESFAVDHDKTGDDLHKVEAQLYDVLILDYYGVGQRFGTGQGLDILKYVRRISPRTRIIAYTSKSLSASESEFFRQSNAVLPKDMGLGDSLALIESELRRAFEKENLFEALLSKLSVTDADEAPRLRSALVSSLKKKDENGFKALLKTVTGKTIDKGVEMIIARLFVFLHTGT